MPSDIIVTYLYQMILTGSCFWAALVVLLCFECRPCIFVQSLHHQAHTHYRLAIQQRHALSVKHRRYRRDTHDALRGRPSNGNSRFRLDAVSELLSIDLHAIDHVVQSASSAFATASAALSPLVANVFQSSTITTAKESTNTLDLLGNDLLVFLCATIGIVPLFKKLNASPVLGFLSAGLLMGPAGLRLFSDLKDMEELADFGVLFLLFEQGLELTVERLTSLSKYAFGMGTLQVFLCTAAFFIFPFIGGVPFLEYFVGADADVVNITRLDEALVIGAALSLSSSAFVLRILQEKNQLSSKFGSASLGILLLQDIAVVPLLVLLPIIENNSGGSMSLGEQASLLGVRSHTSSCRCRYLRTYCSWPLVAHHIYYPCCVCFLLLLAHIFEGDGWAQRHPAHRRADSALPVLNRREEPVL